jgi:hypothetical protein
VAKKIDPVARAIHDIAVAAGAECPEARNCGSAPVKRATTENHAAQTSKPRRRNLTLSQAARMCR